MSTLPDITINGEDIARLLFVARDLTTDEDPDEFWVWVATAFLAAIRNQQGFTKLDKWLNADRLKRLEEEGVFPFWKTEGSDDEPDDED